MSGLVANDLLLSADQQDLLVAALNSNHPSNRASETPALTYSSNMESNPGSGHLDLSDESPYLDFDPDGDYDESFDFDSNARMIGDIPDDTNGDLHEKRKSLEGRDDEDGGGKRREGEDKTAKKPGRKPLTSEPTTVHILIPPLPPD